MTRIASAKPPAGAIARPQLQVRDLELVLALGSLGSTAAASAALSLTQSAISRALGQAEDRLGVRLFERGARGVVATAAGRKLLDGAAGLLEQFVELERSVARPAPSARVRLVCECYTAYRWLPSALAGLSRRSPGLELEVATEHTQDPVTALVEGQIDIALLTTAELPRADATGERLVSRALFSDEIVFVLSAQHPLSRAKQLRVAELRELTLITSETPPAEARWFMKRVFGRHVPRLKFLRFPLTEAVIDATRAGLGVAVLSEWMASGYVEAGGLVTRRLETGRLERPWRIAYAAHATDTASQLVSTLQASARQCGMGPR